MMHPACRRPPEPLAGGGTAVVASLPTLVPAATPAAPHGGRLRSYRGASCSRWGLGANAPHYLIEITFGFASSAFGTSIVRTPSLNSAFTRSATALAGSVKDRLNEP